MHSSGYPSRPQDSYLNACEPLQLNGLLPVHDLSQSYADPHPTTFWKGFTARLPDCKHPPISQESHPKPMFWNCHGRIFGQLTKEVKFSAFFVWSF